MEMNMFQPVAGLICSITGPTGPTGGVTVNGIAIWKGSTWGSVGTGLGGNKQCYALGINGNDFYAGGSFTSLDNVNVNDVSLITGGKLLENNISTTFLNARITSLSSDRKWYAI